jgi:uncharacterized membrane protein
VTGYVLTDRTPPQVQARRTLPAALAVAAVLAQVAYPLTGGPALNRLTIVAVLLFAGASVAHAATAHGPGRALALVLVSGGAGLLAESVGVRTGLPFGDYRYGSSLGPKVLDVPALVPLAWTMMAYPCLLLGRRLASAATRRNRAGAGRGWLSAAVTIGAGALTLASWDLFLDPQMVAAGHWSWDDPTPALPGVPGVPLTNYAGWLLVATVVVGLLHLVLPRADQTRAGRPAGDGAPGALLIWTWAGSTLGNLLFFDRPAVAVWGGLAMGLLVVPYLLAWWNDRP